MTALAALSPGLDFEVPVEVAIVGLVNGMTVGLAAVGLVLVYRVSRVINFAHSALGVLAALALPVLVVKVGLPYLVALPVSLALGAGTGALLELCVVRRLDRAPRLVVMVATIAAAQLVSLAAVLVPSDSDFFSRPFPTLFRSAFDVGSLRVDAPMLTILGAAPVLVAVLTWVRRSTSFGIASQAAAENAEAAWLTGIPVRRISTVAWTTAGLYSSAAAILVASSGRIGGAAAGGLGAAFLVRALAAALVGRLDSFSQTFVAGMAIGLAEALFTWNHPSGGYLQVLLLALVLGCLFFRKGLSRAVRGGEESSWSLAGGLRALPPAVAAHPVVRCARGLGLSGLVLVAVLASMQMTNAQLSLLSSVVIFATMGLSLVVLTGFAGQISLGQASFVALGAFVAGRAYAMGFPPLSVMVYAVGVSAVTALLVGLPALRVRGLFLAVATLTFAVFAQAWLFGQDWLMSAYGQPSQQLRRPTLLGWDLSSERDYAWFCIAAFVVAALIVHRIRVTGVGRSMMAVRDNEPAAMTFSLSPRRTKLLAFGIAGGLAGFSGWLYGGLLVNFSSISLTGPAASLELVVMVVLGGATTISGAVLGALWVKGIPYFLGSTWGLLSSALGVLVVLLYLRGGLASILFDLRDRIVPRLTSMPLDEVRASERQAGVARAKLPPSPDLARSDRIVLEAVDVRVSYGGIVAVDDVSITLREGEILGILGPNGAGKTTFFDVLTGQITPDAGRVLLHGADVTRLRPEARAQLLLGRTFQQARLFDELTLFESMQVALEREAPSEVVPSLLGLPPSRRAELRKRARAAELIEMLGLETFAHRPMTALSTGTRRMAELASVVALGAKVVLLDEPTAGVAQAEVERFTAVLREIADHLGASLIVIEHDIPLMMSLVDRLYVLAAGQVIAEGPPAVVGTDAAVISAYLGTDERTVARSGDLPRARREPLVAAAVPAARSAQVEEAR